MALCLAFRDRCHYDLVCPAAQADPDGPKRLREGDSDAPDAKRALLSRGADDLELLRQALDSHSSFLKKGLYRDATAKLMGLLETKNSGALQRVVTAAEELRPVLANCSAEALMAMRTRCAELSNHGERCLDKEMDNREARVVALKKIRADKLAKEYRQNFEKNILRRLLERAAPEKREKTPEEYKFEEDGDAEKEGD